MHTSGLAFRVTKRVWLPIYLAILLLGQPTVGRAQPNSLPYNSGRLKTVIISEVAISTAAMVGLHYLWYKKFPRSRFHLFNDNGEWLAMDKVGHAVTAYNVSAIQCDLMRWSGVSNTKAAWIGGLTALTMQTIVEIFDGFSTHWGFSKGDMLANIAGSAIFTAQQLAWKDQRIRLKFSFHKTLFAPYNPGELGSNIWQRWIKDYNGQTYWLSINPYSFMKSSTSFPAWLNFTIGYSADGMVAARTNPKRIGQVDIPEFKRQRQFYFSVDADLKRIDKNNQHPQLLLNIPNILKIPAPALEFKKDSAVKLHWLYF
ncbi:MAG TPA: DUF2279 domain-containing protein [Ferruginibacter sp.]|nr:DUF2279 domain-containing protein [Ferruginibacter sp.]HMP21697.1 DUF2279 domain-containing protein [Ferruginibacter sp.]